MFILYLVLSSLIEYIGLGTCGKRNARAPALVGNAHPSPLLLLFGSTASASVQTGSSTKSTGAAVTRKTTSTLHSQHQLQQSWQRLTQKKWTRTQHTVKSKARDTCNYTSSLGNHCNHTRQKRQPPKTKGCESKFVSVHIEPGYVDYPSCTCIRKKKKVPDITYTGIPVTYWSPPVL